MSVSDDDTAIDDGTVATMGIQRSLATSSLSSPIATSSSKTTHKRNRKDDDADADDDSNQVQLVYEDDDDSSSLGASNDSDASKQQQQQSPSQSRVPAKRPKKLAGKATPEERQKRAKLMRNQSRRRTSFYRMVIERSTKLHMRPIMITVFKKQLSVTGTSDRFANMCVANPELHDRVVELTIYSELCHVNGDVSKLPAWLQHARFQQYHDNYARFNTAVDEYKILESRSKKPKPHRNDNGVATVHFETAALQTVARPIIW